LSQNAVSKKTAQRRLELVVMRIDEAGHDDAAAGVDYRGAARLQVWSDAEDILALDQYVGLDKVANNRIHRHYGTAANDVAPTRCAGILRRIVVKLRRSTARSKQAQS
jgi:hypothetical protein